MPDSADIRADLRSGLEDSRQAFHALLDGMDEASFPRQSLNPGWTNGEILAHITFGFMIVGNLLPLVMVFSRLPRPVSRLFAGLLNLFTGPFNWVNKIGARGQGRVFTRRRLAPLFDRSIDHLLARLDAVQEADWQRGMFYPTRWDPTFGEFMTVESLFLYPVAHFKFHTTQLMRP